MTNYVFVLIFLLLWSPPISSNPIDTDSLLRKIIDEHGIRPLPTRRPELDPKYLLGQALFFDSILSGNRDVACATCHLLHEGTGDGLSLSIGVGGTGLGEDRTTHLKIEHPRNSQDLWNRDNNSVTSLFWDGRVEMIDPRNRKFRTPMGDQLPRGLENTLAVQALFPLARHDEMLGRIGDTSAHDLPNGHNGLPNEFTKDVSYPSEGHRIADVHISIMNRLISCQADDRYAWQVQYRDMFQRAYPTRSECDYTIVDLANAIAHFEEIAFATRDTPWDKYVSGTSEALNQEQRSGAILFFGKGKCAICHSGPLFSDFNFHSIGVRQNGPGILAGRDMGRFHATGAGTDKFKFRTPPLRNVTLTAPYFHNGTVFTLEEAITQHLDPLYFADKYGDNGRRIMLQEEIDAVSPVLRRGTQLTDQEIRELIEFLHSLEDYPSDDWIAQVIPADVPSGLPISKN